MRRHPWITAAIILVVLCALLFFGLEWRSEQRWLRYEADARAHGVKLLLTDFTRPEIPDAQNFAALPMMRKAFAGGEDSTPFQFPKKVGSSLPGGNKFSTSWGGPPPFGDPLKGQKIDWVEWQKYFQAAGFLTETSDNPTRDVLQALNHYAPQFQEWSEWRTRGQCRFPLDLAKGANLPLPHLAAFQSAVKVFALRLRAHLALGDSAAAYADFQEGLQACVLLRDEPTLICGLVRISVLAVLLSAVGEGLQDHAWADAECQKIGADLATIRLWEDYRLALESERGFLNITSVTLMRSSRSERAQMVANYSAFGVGPRPIVFQAMPRFIIRENQLRLNRYLDELLARVDARSQSFDPDRPAPSSPEHITGSSGEAFFFLFMMSGSVYREIERRYVTMHTKLDQARLACALERFRGKNGAYPAALAELVPDFIATAPTDPYSGLAYRYQRIGETSFRLYSVGENRTDDGGQIAPGVQERKQLDALWLYAPSELTRP